MAGKDRCSQLQTIVILWVLASRCGLMQRPPPTVSKIQKLPNSEVNLEQTILWQPTTVPCLSMG